MGGQEGNQYESSPLSVKNALGLVVPGTSVDVYVMHVRLVRQEGARGKWQEENWLKCLLKGCKTFRSLPLLYTARLSPSDSFLHVTVYSPQRLKRGLYIGGHQIELMTLKQKN